MKLKTAPMKITDFAEGKMLVKNCGAYIFLLIPDRDMVLVPLK